MINVTLCPVCQENNVGNTYCLCATCINRVVNVNGNFTLSNIPRDIERLFPEPLLNVMPQFVKDDANDLLDLLRNGYQTPAILMAARIFESILFDYYDEDFFENDDDEDECEVPFALGNLIDTLKEYIDEEVCSRWSYLKEIRNDAMHGKQRYNLEDAFGFSKEILQITALVANGNNGIIPDY